MKTGRESNGHRYNQTIYSDKLRDRKDKLRRDWLLEYTKCGTLCTLTAPLGMVTV